MHSFVFSKLRIASHSKLESRCVELELNQQQKVAALELRCIELELNQQQKIAALELRCDELELSQQQKISAMHSHYNALTQNQGQKIAALEAHCDMLKQQCIQLRAIQEGLIAALKQNCRLTKQLLHKTQTHLDVPYLKYPLSFDEQLNRLKELEPNAFDLWWQCFLNAEQEYARTVEGNLSYGLHLGAAGFNHFIKPFLKGNILDVGCGPQILPSYLHGTIEKEDIRFFGLDPLYAEHPFEFYHGFAEFLPWQANCFDVVICATSLDHFLSLKKSLEEIKRVLKLDGKFLVWVGFTPGGKAYDPNSNELCAIDKYHLFHFDREWFEVLMANYFNLIDRVKYDASSYFYVFSSSPQ